MERLANRRAFVIRADPEAIPEEVLHENRKPQYLVFPMVFQGDTGLGSRRCDPGRAATGQSAGFSSRLD